MGEVIQREDLATLLSIYWHTGTIGTSMRMYRSTFGSGSPPSPFAPAGLHIDVPTHVAAFREPIVPPRTLLEPHFNLQRYTRMDSGGHFPALEATAHLADDLRAAFN